MSYGLVVTAENGSAQIRDDGLYWYLWKSAKPAASSYSLCPVSTQYAVPGGLATGYYYLDVSVPKTSVSNPIICISEPSGNFMRLSPYVSTSSNYIWRVMVKSGGRGKLVWYLFSGGLPSGAADGFGVNVYTSTDLRFTSTSYPLVIIGAYGYPTSGGGMTYGGDSLTGKTLAMAYGVSDFYVTHIAKTNGPWELRYGTTVKAPTGGPLSSEAAAERWTSGTLIGASGSGQACSYNVVDVTNYPTNFSFT